MLRDIRQRLIVPEESDKVAAGLVEDGDGVRPHVGPALDVLIAQPPYRGFRLGFPLGSRLNESDRLKF